MTPSSGLLTRLVGNRLTLRIEGSGGSNNNLRNIFGIGEGTANLYRDLVVAALLSLFVITWPNAQEKEEISNRFLETSKFRNCVGVMTALFFPWHFVLSQKMPPTILVETCLLY